MEIVFIVIFLIIGVLILIKSTINVVDSVKTSPHNSAGKNASDYLKYYEDLSRLTPGYAVLLKRDPYIRKIVSVTAERELEGTYTPDKIVYTGATVGGVTTGGISTIPGGYNVYGGKKTGNYYLWHNYARLDDSIGHSGWVGNQIFSIVLSQNDFEIARKDPILSKRLISSQALKDGKRLNIDSLKDSRTLIVNTASKEDCNYILSWLCGEK